MTLRSGNMFTFSAWAQYRSHGLGIALVFTSADRSSTPRKPPSSYVGIYFSNSYRKNEPTQTSSILSSENVECTIVLKALREATAAIKRATSAPFRSFECLSASSLEVYRTLFTKAQAQAAASERTFMLKPSEISDLRNLDFPLMSAISPRPKPSTSLRSELSLTTSPTAGDPAVVAGDVCDMRTVVESEWRGVSESGL